MLDWLASKPQHLLALPPGAGVTGAGDSDSGPHAFVASIFTNQTISSTLGLFCLYYFSDPAFSSIVLCLRTIDLFALSAFLHF